MKLTRANTLSFELPDGRTLIVPPVTRGQVRAAIALDPPEDRVLPPGEADENRARQLAILLAHASVQTPGSGDAEPVQAAVLDSLTAGEEQDILAAIIVHHHGADPINAVAVSAALRLIALKKKAVEPGAETTTGSEASTTTPSSSPPGSPGSPAR